ncbi:hypothetical protein KFK09_027347 [Dendrobium nobile]|uniref:Uncharacterized protein n=1 Tax=Dendrobium nobile TaxID=94219 RepID=A0A8T3AAT3_DENNO|nr:hypothetical protein KFK09_027347 [Dendrobium nobile]
MQHVWIRGYGGDRSTCPTCRSLVVNQDMQTSLAEKSEVQKFQKTEPMSMGSDFCTIERRKRQETYSKNNVNWRAKGMKKKNFKSKKLDLSLPSPAQPDPDWAQQHHAQDLA